jgi:hypothetical protein
MVDKINAHFDFVVQGVTFEDARALNMRIINAVELLDASTGGGWYVEDDKDNVEKLAELDANIYEILDAKFKTVTKEADTGNASNETIIWLRGYAQAICYAKKVVSGEIGDEG